MSWQLAPARTSLFSRLACMEANPSIKERFPFFFFWHFSSACKNQYGMPNIYTTLCCFSKTVLSKVLLDSSYLYPLFLVIVNIIQPAI